jgi:hypothetical protein
MTRYVFEEVKVRVSKRVTCPVCGKRRNIRKSFYQTLNPFNVNADGAPKSRSEIQLELAHEARAWVLEPEPCPRHLRDEMPA